MFITLPERDLSGKHTVREHSSRTDPAYERLTTNPDHNSIRHGPIPADALIPAIPGERRYPTACAYFASKRSRP